MLQILNMRNIKGELPPNAVYVGRPGENGYPLHWGNPFDMQAESERDKVCDAFDEWFPGEMDNFGIDQERLEWMQRNIILLHGRDLGCWCPPKRCHAETLAKAAAASSDKPVFRVIVAGGRDFADYKMLSAHLDKLLGTKSKTHTIVIISGLARGADLLGKRYGEEHGYHVAEFPAFWDVQGRGAGYARNAEMAKYADALIAFWDGQSSGTKHMIEHFTGPTRVVHY